MGIIALILTLCQCSCASITPLVEKKRWETVANFLTLGNEKKFNRIHQSFSGISSDHEYADVSKKIINKMDRVDWSIRCGDVPWRFFEHLESRKLFAENVKEVSRMGYTALQH